MPTSSGSQLLMESDFLLIDIVRGDIEAGDTGDVLGILTQLLDREPAQKFCECVDVRCTGYDSDPRELWEIPEVKAFVCKLDQEFPYWCYLLDRGGNGLLWLICCLYPVARTQEEQNRLWPPAIRAYVKERGIPAMNIACRVAGCSDEEALRLTKSAADYLVYKPMGKFRYEDYVKPHQAATSVRFSGANERSEAQAQYYAGALYYEGKQLNQDFKLAAMWLRKAADKDCDEAQYLLGILYLLGQGVTQDIQQATSWYGRAAKNGHAEAQFYLATLFAHGAGVPQDMEKAAFWLQKAARQGHEGAQDALRNDQNNQR